jgi:DNA-binding transcriptional MerR regulator
MMTLDELESEVRKELDRLGLAEAQADGRVAAVPDARTIRYYTTLGLLDRPRIYRREARYEQRHVLQIVAIKALQSASLPLAEIQERLYGRTDAELQSMLAAIPKREPEFRPVRWREVVVEPGLRVLVSEEWLPGERSEERIRTALKALGNGGTL